MLNYKDLEVEFYWVVAFNMILGTPLLIRWKMLCEYIIQLRSLFPSPLLFNTKQKKNYSIYILIRLETLCDCRDTVISFPYSIKLSVVLLRWSILKINYWFTWLQKKKNQPKDPIVRVVSPHHIYLDITKLIS